MIQREADWDIGKEMMLRKLREKQERVRSQELERASGLSMLRKLRMASQTLGLLGLSILLLIVGGTYLIVIKMGMRQKRMNILTGLSRL